MARIRLQTVSDFNQANVNFRRVEGSLLGLYDGETDFSRFEQVVIPAACFRPPGVSDPSWDSSEGAWSFTGTVNNNVLHGSFQLPRGYSPQTAVKFLVRLHWITAAADQQVKWNLAYKWHNISASINAWTTLSDSFVLSQGANISARHEFEISATGKESGSEFKFQLQRAATEASDSFGDQVFVDAAAIQFIARSYGNALEFDR